MNIFSFFRRNLRKKKSYFYIEKDFDLNILNESLDSCNIFGIDTEFDWRTTYLPKLSLLQISTPSEIFVIDSIKVSVKDVLKKYLEDDLILKIFHSVRSDTTILSKCLNCHTKNVFDIQIAEKFISKDNIKSYGKIINKYFGINLKKTETNSNWLKRPLTEDQIKYAIDDVDYLIETYLIQRKILKKNKILDKVFMSSEEEAFLGNQPLKALRLKKQKKLSKRDKEIFSWREDLALKKNIPPSYIFKDKYLTKLYKLKSKDVSAKEKLMKIIGDSLVVEQFITKFL